MESLLMCVGTLTKSEDMNDDGLERHDEYADEQPREEIHSKVVRAGKRTYFFDVKATRRNDYYLTITESKKRFGRDGKFFYEKHKLFLYKEDFNKFADTLKEAIEYIREANPQPIEVEEDIQEKAHEAAVAQEQSNEYTSVEFEDLEDNNA